jgi:NADH-quinone oxidoreductase subunit K
MPDGESLLNNTLALGAMLFALGLVGFITRRNLIVLFLCAELMLQGVSLTFVAFGRHHGTWGGQIFAIVSLAIAAAEAAVALALIVVLFRRQGSLDVSIWQDLREEDQPPILDDKVLEEPLPEPQWPHLYPSGRLPELADPTVDDKASLPLKVPQPVLPPVPPKNSGADKRGAL